MKTSRRVCIIQPVMKAYRVSFFEKLADDLRAHGVVLQVVYGRPWPEEAQRGDNVSLPSPLGQEVPTWVLGGKLFVQPHLWPWLQADLVIIEHANKHLLSWLLLALRALGLKRLAFWGHGRDSKADPAAMGERIKRRSLHAVDWWFAYSAGAAAYVAKQGFDRGRITVVENAVDTRVLREQLNSIGGAEVENLRAQLGWLPGEPVAVYCGSLYTNKRLDLLFHSADLLHQRQSGYRLLIIGGGPMQADVQAFCASRPWVRAVGPRFGRDKALHLRLASLWLNPGALGLGILDAFVAGLPMVTTTNPGHGPEIEYLEDGVNGLVLAPDATAFAQGVADLLDQPQRLAAQQSAARAAGGRYAIETMVKNFSTGVRQCLAR
jgi:L-malate glycosyltransferase